MALMFAICNPQPNWIPRKPKLMFQTCQKVRGGLSMDSSTIVSVGLRLQCPTETSNSAFSGHFSDSWDVSLRVDDIPTFRLVRPLLALRLDAAFFWGRRG